MKQRPVNLAILCRVDSHQIRLTSTSSGSYQTLYFSFLHKTLQDSHQLKTDWWIRFYSNTLIYFCRPYVESCFGVLSLINFLLLLTYIYREPSERANKKNGNNLASASSRKYPLGISPTRGTGVWSAPCSTKSEYIPYFICYYRGISLPLIVHSWKTI